MIKIYAKLKGSDIEWIELESYDDEDIFEALGNIKTFQKNDAKKDIKIDYILKFERE